MKTPFFFLLLIVVGLGIAACAGGSGPPLWHNAGTAEVFGAGASKVKHVVIVIQENRSFDNFFATFPGANGTTMGRAIAMPSPIASACAKLGQRVVTSATTIPLTEVSLLGIRCVCLRRSVLTAATGFLGRI